MELQEKHLFEYAVIRVVPRVDRGEFINAGVILYCRPHKFLRSQFELSQERLRAFGGIDAGTIEEHLQAFERICRGDKDSGPIGRLPIGERFRWLTAPRSTIVQTSAVHTGLCTDPAETLETLVAKLVLT